MKMSTASNMCTLSCALIVCTLVSTARTTNTNTNEPNKPKRKFDSRETTTEEIFEDWTILPSTTPIANGEYGSKPTPSTPPITDYNESLYPDVIDSSTKPENDYIPSDKKNSYTTEPIPTTNGTQLLAELPLGTQPLTTTPIANGRYTTTTTTPGTNLNDTMQGDEANVSPSEDVIGNSLTPETNKYSSTEPIETNDHTQTTLKEPPTSTTFTAIQKDGSTTTPGTPSITDLNDKPPQDVIENSTSQPANDDTLSKPKKSKTKWSNSPIPFIWFTTERPTRYYRTTEWIKPTRNCECVFGKPHSIRCKKNEKEITTAKVWGRFAEYKQWDQQRHMSETTTNNVQGQSEKSKKWKLQQKVLEMESNRLNTILDVFNSR